jgi:lactoylglutathione lyase
MLRIKDPEKSLAFYRDQLGMTLIDTMDFPQYKFSLYFLTTLPAGGEEYKLTPGTQEAHDYLWNMEGVALELTHNHGTETDGAQAYHAGNQEGDGFGHIAVNVDDVYATTDKLLAAGYAFKKKPDEGRMKGLAFVYDPDGYWVEIVKRGVNHGIKNEMNFSQTMLRVKDPAKSIPFYRSLGMKVLNEKHFDDFSLYFLASSSVDESVPCNEQFQPVLELTHNHGTETDPDFKHYSGNEEGRQGFGHVGFLVDDVYQACDAIRPAGYGFRKEPDGGSMRGLAFAYDPDGYSVEIIKRGGLDFGDVKKEA